MENYMDAIERKGLFRDNVNTIIDNILY